MQTDKDIIWVEKCLAGDRQAFRQILVHHQDMVYSIAKNILKDPEESADVTQLVFLKAYEKLASFKQGSMFSTWLYRIAYNMSVSALRSQKHRKSESFVPDFERFHNRPDVGSDEVFEKEEEMQLLGMAIETLEADDRGLISLYYLQDQSVEQISKITGLGHSNIKVRLFRIRKKLHDYMLSRQKSLILQV